jgi:predicted MPP superfamily phosphohydrolase
MIFALSLGAGTLCLIGFLTYLYACVAAKRYRLERLEIVLKSDIGSRRQFTVLHLSDLHLCRGDHDKAAFLRSVTNDDYDMVVLTGDIFEDRGGIDHASSLLVKKPKLGAYAVLGNHDYYDYTLFNKTVGTIIRRYKRPAARRDVGPFVKALEKQGYHVLRNELIEVPDARISIIGIDYPGIEETQLKQLVSQVNSNSFLMALFHLPKDLAMICRSGVSLVFGGHTHGGQVRMPGVGAIVTDSELPRHEASGLIWREETAFHISRGLGADPRTNFRLFCPPAATVLEVVIESRFH